MIQWDVTHNEDPWRKLRIDSGKHVFRVDGRMGSESESVAPTDEGYIEEAEAELHRERDALVWGWATRASSRAIVYTCLSPPERTALADTTRAICTPNG